VGYKSVSRITEKGSGISLSIALPPILHPLRYSTELD